MRVIAFKKIKEFYVNHSSAEIALRDWYTVVNNAKWLNFAELKNSFNSADNIGNDHFVFNIKGNNFRLIATVRFDYGIVYIRHICTHAEYDKIKDCSIL